MRSPYIFWTPALRVCAACLLALTLAIVLWHAALAPPSKLPTWFSIALHTCPLWPALFLLWRRHYHMPFTAALAGLLLFALGVMEAWAAPAHRGFALLQVALCVGMVGGASWDGLRARFAARRAL